MRIISACISLFVLFGCANNSNQSKMIEWYSGLEQNLSVKEVIELQPEFVDIDWDKPDSIFYKQEESISVRYFMYANQSNDILNMSYFLEFKNDSLIGGFAHK